ncbi:hypothetical protein FB45DRAFT_1038907 [Roridomyces roridus]|uniref:Uncharacterized protein n=1 Tax=Roridomyces roridus TaxID=1738132 RepID=A0AAD7B3I1_9AGAR|nr:hypothetical protein FB45DRAFT_1038907 [Roridomyces roridus]
MQTTYQHHRLDISIKIVEFMAVQPTAPFFVSYDYAPRTIVPVEIEVLPLAHLNADIRNAYSARLECARGRVTLHPLAMEYTNYIRITPFVLRAASSRFFNGLAQVAASGIQRFRRPELEHVIRALIAVTAGEKQQFC